MWVIPNISFCIGRNIARGPDRATHNHNFLNMIDKFRISLEGSSNIGKGADRTQNYLTTILPTFLHNIISCAHLNLHAIGLLDRNITKPLRAMHMMRWRVQRLHQWLGCPFRHIDAVMSLFGQQQRIPCSLRDKHIAEDGCQAQNFKVGMRKRIMDGHGIINARVCIYNQFLLHLFVFHF